jgi:hypothetical protein
VNCQGERSCSLPRFFKVTGVTREHLRARGGLRGKKPSCIEIRPGVRTTAIYLHNFSGRGRSLSGGGRGMLDQKTEFTSLHRYRFPIRGYWLISKSGRCIGRWGCEAKNRVVSKFRVYRNNPVVSKFGRYFEIVCHIEITGLYRNSALFRCFPGISK